MQWWLLPAASNAGLAWPAASPAFIYAEPAIRDASGTAAVSRAAAVPRPALRASRATALHGLWSWPRSPPPEAATGSSRYHGHCRRRGRDHRGRCNRDDRDGNHAVTTSQAASTPTSSASKAATSNKSGFPKKLAAFRAFAATGDASQVHQVASASDGLPSCPEPSIDVIVSPALSVRALEADLSAFRAERTAEQSMSGVRLRVSQRGRLPGEE